MSFTAAETIEDLCASLEALLLACYHDEHPGSFEPGPTANNMDPEWHIALGSLGRARKWGEKGVATPQKAAEDAGPTAQARSDVRVGQVYRGRRTGVCYRVTTGPVTVNPDGTRAGWACEPLGGPFLGYGAIIVYLLDDASRYELVTRPVGV